MTGYKPNPYPGYNPNPCTEESPRANPRLRPEAEQFANQGRGSLDLFSANPRYVDEPMPEPRCPGYAARQNYEVGRHGTVNKLLYGQESPRFEVGAPRVKPEAEETAIGHQGRQTAAMFNSYGRLPLSPANPARVKPEAESAAEPHKGERMNGILHDPEKLPSSSRPVPRVTAQASENAELDRGGQMSKNLHHYGSVSSRPDGGVPRVRPEAEGIAEQGKGTMNVLMGKYGKLPLSSRPEPRVKDSGQEFAHMGKGGRMSRLVYEGNRLPQDPKPAPRATSKAAKQILKANRGQMAAIFAAQGKRQNVSTPGLARSVQKTY